MDGDSDSLFHLVLFMPSFCSAPLRPATQDEQNSAVWLEATEGGLGASCRLRGRVSTGWVGYGLAHQIYFSEVALLGLPSNHGGGDALGPNSISPLRERVTGLHDEGVTPSSAPLLFELR